MNTRKECLEPVKESVVDDVCLCQDRDSGGIDAILIPLAADSRPRGDLGLGPSEFLVKRERMTT